MERLIIQNVLYVIQTFKYVFFPNAVLFSKFCAGKLPWISYGNNLEVNGHNSCSFTNDRFHKQVSHTYLHTIRVDGRKIRIVFSTVTSSYYDHTDRCRHCGSLRDPEKPQLFWAVTDTVSKSYELKTAFGLCITSKTPINTHTDHILHAECRPLQVTVCSYP